jgi:subtilisin family serine protease
MQKRSIYLLIVVVLILAILGYFYTFEKTLFSPLSQEKISSLEETKDQAIKQEANPQEKASKQNLISLTLNQNEKVQIFKEKMLIYSRQAGDQKETFTFSPGPLVQDEQDKLEVIRSRGYIVEFTEEPLVKTALSAQKRGADTTSAVQQQKQAIDAKSNTIKSALVNKNAQVEKTFSKAFAGAYINTNDEASIKELKDQGLIKQYWPNYIVEANLLESVPLIDANDVWLLDANGNRCDIARVDSSITSPTNNPSVTADAIAPTTKKITPEQQIPGPCITGKGIKIGIIDTGIDYTHPDLGGCSIIQYQNGECIKVSGVDGYDFVDDDPDPMDCHGHGTHVAATAAGKGTLADGRKIYGVAPDATIVAYRVLTCDGWGYDYWIIDAIERSVDPNQDGNFSDHLDVISMSLGGGGTPDDPMSIAVDNAADAGVTAVIAAGNSGSNENTIGSPGTSKKAITVGAVDKELNMAYFSSRGPVIWQNENNGKTYSLMKPDVVAPGVNICAAQWDSAWEYSQCLDDQHTSISGTSMATPHVSGLVALMKQRNKNLVPEEVKSILHKTSHPLPYSEKITTQGRGIVNAMDAVFFNNPIIVALNPIELGDRYLDFTGYIAGPITNYELAYAPNLPLSEIENWTTILIGNQSGPLSYENFDITTLADGNYLLRLRAFDTQGRTFDDYGYFQVKKFTVIEPLNNDILNSKNNNTIKIINELNLSIDNFEVEYTFEGGPYTNQGIRIIQAQGHELIAQLDANTIQQTGYIDNLKITINENNLEDVLLVHQLYFDTTLKVGWPQKILAEEGIHPHWGFKFWYWLGYLEPAIGDVNGDGLDETIVYAGGNPPKLKIFSNSGNLIQTIPVGEIEEWGVAGGNLHYPLLADLDNNGDEEIIAYNYLDQGDVSMVFAFNGDGSLIPGWPVTLTKDFHATLMAADLNNDNSLEIIVKGNDIWNEESITIISANGMIINNWLYDDSELGGGVNWYPAIGSLDSDNEMEIVTTSPREVYIDGGDINNGSLSVYNPDGSLIWKKDIAGQPMSPNVADIDNDGQQEIIVGVEYSSNVFPDERFGGLYVFDKFGNIKSGWPQLMGWNFYSNPAIFDYNHDNLLEIAASRLGFVTYAFTHNGEIITPWPQYTCWNDWYGAIAGSLSSNIGILISSGSYYCGGGLYGWDLGTNQLESFPKITDVDIQAPSIIADIDQDQKTEVIGSSDWDYDSVTQKYKKRGSIYVWETNDNLQQQFQNWPYFHHDKQLTGCYDCETINNTNCTESWQCGPWSECINGTQTRNCVDINNCGTIYHKPPTSQSCGVINSTDAFNLYYNETLGASLTNNGDVYLRIYCRQNSTCEPPNGDSYIIYNTNNEPVAFITDQGKMCIEGYGCSNQQASCNATTNDFIIQDTNGQPKVVISNSGELCYTGNMIIG